MSLYDPLFLLLDFLCGGECGARHAHPGKFKATVSYPVEIRLCTINYAVRFMFGMGRAAMILPQQITAELCFALLAFNGRAVMLPAKHSCCLEAGIPSSAGHATSGHRCQPHGTTGISSQALPAPIPCSIMLLYPSSKLHHLHVDHASPLQAPCGAHLGR